MKIEIMSLAAPTLEFGDNGEAIDPKTGLQDFGPFSRRFGAAHKSQVRIGLVGPRECLDNAVAWFQRCQHPLISEKQDTSEYLNYPGFEGAFHSSLILDNRWQIEIDAIELSEAFRLEPRQRFQNIIDLYGHCIERLSNMEVRPDVTVCCLSADIVRDCRSVSNSGSEAARVVRQKRKKEQNSDQLQLFGVETEETAEDLLFRDLRRALKSRSMRYRMPIQIATPRLFLDEEASQDAAARAWNVGVALFYKAGGIPWRLKSDGPETCFVGISFHHLRTNRRHLVYSSLAQAFSTEGDGFALRGESIPWDDSQGRNPHLSEEQASRLISEVLREYRERSGNEPARVVIHKTSKFDAAERHGFSDALRQIPVTEMVNLLPTDFRLVRHGVYPPKRGTLCRVNETSNYLFTTGYVPEWETYPGPHIPVPLMLITDDEADTYRIATDIIGLSRMNWNTARDTSGLPITIRFSREVGGIMAEYSGEFGIEAQPNSSYRYYM